MRLALLFELALIAAFGGTGILLAVSGVGEHWIWPLVLVPYLIRNLYYLLRLSIQIHRHNRLVPPFPLGLWGEIHRAIAQYQQRSRKRRKRQLRFTRRFREAANSVPDALVILDKNKRIDWANPAAASLMNVQWPEDNGTLLTAILHHPDLDELIDGNDVRPIDLSPEHNQTVKLSLHITPFGERKRQRLVVGRDITKIYHLNMIRRDFVANASHELRTPLTVIAGFLENLAGSPTTPDGHRRPLELMQSQTGRMCSIIEDLLTLSRLEILETSDEIGTVDVPEELRLLLREAQVLSNGQHTIVANVDSELLLQGSASELRSTFSNLLHNAVKHTQPGSRIEVSWCRDDEGPVFSVKDNGMGIPLEHIPRLTERFYRVDTARSRASGGTGLGLAIVKHVLNRHGAHLGIASEPGRGSTFSCHFRSSSEAGEAESPEENLDSASLHPGYRVEA